MPDLDYKMILGAITILMIVVGHGKYIVDTYKGKTTPHLYTWITFFIIGVITFLIQNGDGAGPGAWGTLGTCIAGAIIIVLAFRQGSKNITISDSISFVFGLLAIVAYVGISNPSYALVLTILINVFAFYPTFRKTYYEPNEETLISYTLAGTRSLLSIFALYNLSFLTLASPMFLILVNTVFVVMVYIRKKQLNG